MERFNPSQFRSKLRQLQQKQKQEIDRYNRAAREANRKIKRSIDQYNQEVRAHNSRVLAAKQRIRAALNRFSSQATTNRYLVFRTSVHTFHESYVRLANRMTTKRFGEDHDIILNLSKNEAANSLEVFNLLENQELDTDISVDDLQTVQMADELRKISPDLDDRWKGAVYSLNPKNPDAARHFCTSSREIFTQILEIKAPDNEVLNAFPDCDRTERGNPTRREKIRFLLHKKGIGEDTLEDFVEQDMDNTVQLFVVLNEGTHGFAGKFNMRQLSSIKQRVEDGILFLSKLVT